MAPMDFHIVQQNAFQINYIYKAINNQFLYLLQRMSNHQDGNIAAAGYEEEPAIKQLASSELEDIVEEAKKFHQSFQNFKKKEFFSHESVYLVSTKWLRRWKIYVSYEEVINQKPYSKFIGCGDLPFINEDIIDAQQKFTLQFHQKNFAHLNTKLKNDLCEGKDFEYLDKATWNVLYDSFQGYELKRMVQKSADGKIVELYFQKISVVPIVNDVLKDIQSERVTKLIEVTFQFSKYATIKQFKEIAGQIIKRYIEKKEHIYIDSSDFIKLWLMPEKLRKPILLNTLHQGCKANPSFTYKLFTTGQLIEDDKKIGDLNIVKETLIVAQLRQSYKNWIFFNLTHRLKASCSYCKKQEELSYVCSCKYAVYCTKECKTSDKSHHKWRCPNEAESDEEEKELSLNQKSRRGLTGLRNLGNTCFMNSGLQCLSHIPQLTDYFLSKKYLKDINVDNPLGTHGQLSTEYAKMIANLWLGQQPTFSPSHLKNSIGKFQPMFSGYNQHDSGELITYLLDGLHEDLNRVIVKPYTQIKDYDGRPDAIIAKEAWETFLKRNQSIVVDLMYGQYKSKVQCPKEQCKNISITFDPFSVCSLPLINKSKKKLELTYMKDYIYSKKFQITYGMDRDYTLQQKMNQIKDILGIDQSQELVLYVSSFSNCEILKASEALNDLKREYSYKTIYVRQLNPYQHPQSDIKIMVSNVSKNFYYPGQTYRKNISPYHIFYVNPKKTNKEVYHQIISCYSKILGETYSNEEEFYNKFINIDEKDELFRILLIPASRYYACAYCDKKECTGCKLPYNQQLFSDYVKYNPDVEYQREKKFQIELFWRQDQSQIEKLFNQIKQVNQTYFSKINQKTSVSVKQSGVSIYDCLKLFENEEILAQQNAWYCPKCKDFVLAKKQMKIYKAPKILALCLKRFKRKDYFSQKIGCLVDFPVEGLDLTDYIANPDLPEDYFKSQSMDIQGNNVIYDLIAISNHFGGTGGGHYTAYCKDPTSGDWYDFDDSSISRLRSVQSVVSESAYILFYKRR